MKKNLQMILERIAKENHTTPENVYREMQIAIDAAYDNPNPEVRKNWKMIPFEGERPTPEDVIFGLGMMLSPGENTCH